MSGWVHGRQLQNKTPYMANLPMCFGWLGLLSRVEHVRREDKGQGHMEYCGDNMVFLGFECCDDQCQSILSGLGGGEFIPAFT